MWVEIRNFCFAIYIILANIYLFKVNNRNTGERSEKCSKTTIKTPNDVIDVDVPWDSKFIYTCTTRLEDTHYVSSFDGTIGMIRNNKYEQEL